ncbi:aspartic proteinase PCS1-like [Cucurbita maxima]|uniref:Aspartic proteinase PCS1-like n=1 Tax=Cucurbita maxima TaxID=3661 RepID=A0A6J1I7C0_CUCMA|nr:aspartic proteinase PCS1-like [Cucurbita maxima]
MRDYWISLNPLNNPFLKYCFSFFLISLVFVFQNPLLCFSLNPALILPLKTQVIPPESVWRSPDKLPFRHNVSLTVSLTVGTPPQNVTMVIDTGSELSWLHCNRSQNSSSSSSTFNPVQSSSYTPIPCSSSTCTDQTRDFPIPASCDSNQLCHATLSYADASSSEGNLAADTFYIGNSSIPNVVFGCMDSIFSSNNVEDSKNTGLMGMNRGSLSFVSQMGFPKFSYCISEYDFPGLLLLGDANFSWLAPLNYTPMIQISTPLPYFDRVAYTVQLQGIKVSNKLLPIPESVFEPDHTGAGQTMVDSGTQFTFLLGQAYTVLRDEFLNQTAGSLRVFEDPNFVFQGAMDLCYRVPTNQTRLPPLPAVTLVFRGAEMTVTGDRILYKVAGEIRGNDTIYCFTFGNADLLGVEAYVIGHLHQQNVWMEFDLKKSRIGLVEIRCDLAGQKLGMGL